MTNHPNRGLYTRTLDKLDRIALDGKIAPDCRRLATDESLRMRAAQSRPTDTQVKSDASYQNLFHAVPTDEWHRGWKAWKRADQEAAAAERETMMNNALHSATQFLAAWNL